MNHRLAEAEEELDRHHLVVMDAGSLPAVMEEADNHDSRMGRILDGMDDAMGSMMSHCSASGMSHMHEMMSGMQNEMREHAGILEDVTELSAAQSFCESHVVDMREMLTSMQDVLDQAECGIMHP
jgi:hypothetical protein